MGRKKHTAEEIVAKLRQSAMTAQGCALRFAWLRAPPQSRRAIFPMCYGIQLTDNKPVDEEAEAKAAAYWATQDGPRLYRWHSFEWACEQTKIE